jgi:hypothetical protein
VFKDDVFESKTMASSRYGVSLPVGNPTKSFWLDTPGANPLADEGSTGLLTNEADVCIIGSGMTGVSAAWHLSKMLDLASRESTTRIVVLEAREFCEFLFLAIQGAKYVY